MFDTSTSRRSRRISRGLRRFRYVLGVRNFLAAQLTALKQVIQEPREGTSLTEMSDGMFASLRRTKAARAALEVMNGEVP